MCGVSGHILRLTLVLLLSLAACTGGAVVFAPTETPPNLSPVRYTHPGGAFSVVIPRTWSVYEQHTATLAAASFSAPGALEPALLITVVNLGESVDSTAFATLINTYQEQVRPDLMHYKEQDRQAMGDGSWRLTGLRDVPGGSTDQINTFVEHSGALVGVVDVLVPDDPTQASDLQTAINTFTINSENTTLEVANLAALAYASRSSLVVQSVSAWKTPGGVFFITGEIANTGTLPLSGVPVRAVLHTAEGVGIAEAVDTVMGYTLPPGGFAPFSLRFGQGQPALTTEYMLTLGSDDWQPETPITIYGPDHLTWTDESSFTDTGGLLVTGTVTNTSADTVRNLLVIVTVFDGGRNVIAAGFSDIAPEQLAPEASASFQVVVPEMGGRPANYILTIQGLP